MDTRSVIRSRRKSARLMRQQPDNKPTEQLPTRRRGSGTNKSGAKAATPKHPSSRAATTKEIPRTRSMKAAPFATISKSPTGAKNATNTQLKAIERHQQVGTATQRSIPLSEASDSIDTSSQENKAGGRKIKTENGAIRLIDERASRDTRSPDEESQGSKVSELPTTLRRSARPASSMPKIKDKTMSATGDHRKGMQPLASGSKDIAATPSEKGTLTTEDNSPKAAELQSTPKSLSSAGPSDPNLIDLDELLPQDSSVSLGHSTEGASFAELTSPIPELLAGIARIIDTSSPTAARVSGSNNRYTNDNTTPNESPAVLPSPAPALAFGIAPNANAPIVTKEILTGNQLAGAFDDTASRPQTVTADSPKPNHVQSIKPGGVKRHADEMNHEEQIDKPRQQLAASNSTSPFAVVHDPTNTFQTASKRDDYLFNNDQLGGTSGGTWLDGEVGEIGRASGIQEEFDGPSSQTGAFTRIRFSPEVSHTGLNHSVHSRDHHHQAIQDREDSITATPQLASQPGTLHETLKCGDCGKSRAKVLVCVRCLETYYCGKYCQIWNWPIHRQECKISEEADPDEVERMEEYLEKMWGGALRMLKESVIDPGLERDKDMEQQGSLQYAIGGHSMVHSTGEDAIQEITSPGSDGGDEAITGEDAEDIGQHRHSARGTKMGRTDEEIQNQEENFVLEVPSSPKSLFRSRAMALRLAQAAEASAK